ncbi:DUF6875 domain-containing protein [Nocardia sp. IBHARD005]|uniref:DUF6875 domain-containing protein n=1 Tax=Nocardia sp. IBHARD005 TaxID=3457765 RepID=UPI004057DF45
MNTDGIIGTRSGMRPTNLFSTDPAILGAEHPRAAELRRWIREHLCRTHRDLGRPGPVCPYIGRTIAQQNLWVSFVEGRHISTQCITAIVDDLNDLFEAIPPQREPDNKHKAILAIFPDLIDYADLDAVQDEQKTRFVDKGLMLGQFYPGCTAAGLHNPRFPALDAPLPSLAVRNMVPTDYPFLDSRYEWIDTYLGLFAPTIPGFISSSIAAKLAETPTTRNSSARQH